MNEKHERGKIPQLPTKRTTRGPFADPKTDFAVLAKRLGINGFELNQLLADERGAAEWTPIIRRRRD